MQLTELYRASHPVIRDLISKYIVGIKETSRLLKLHIVQLDQQLSVCVWLLGQDRSVGAQASAT